MKTYTFNISPVAKPRMTQRDKWSPSLAALKYFNFKDHLNILAFEMKYKVSVPLSISFIVPVSKSWSKTKKNKMLGRAHTQKPDLDNFIKAFKDALLPEDSIIHEYGRMKKLWGEKGQIIVWENEK